LQYGYTGAQKDEGAGFSGRTKRIFHRGHQGEEWMIDWIRAAGFELRTSKNGKQFGFEDCDGRFKGHIDGVVTGGPDGFKYPALWENKVLGSKGFKSLERHGVRKAYPAYAAQVATYQAYMQLAEHPAFFTAVNADTMEIALYLVPFNAELAQKCADKAAHVLTATDAGDTLPRATEDPASFVCRFCPYKQVCWRDDS
jgi:CRISPR/Cas system-associated exonuclease Cas4 (RecB family)